MPVDSPSEVPGHMAGHCWFPLITHPALQVASLIHWGIWECHSLGEVRTGAKAGSKVHGNGH